MKEVDEKESTQHKVFPEDVGLFKNRGKIRLIDSFQATIRWLVMFTVIQSSITGGLFIASISSIGTEFGFGGTEKGLISASYGVSAALASVPFGLVGRKNPQAWLGIGGIIVSSSAIWYSFSKSLPFFVAGHFMLGAGGTAVTVLGPIHVDNQIDIDKSLVPKYTSFLLASIAFGVVIGIVIFIPFANNNCKSTTDVLCNKDVPLSPTMSITPTLTWDESTNNETCFGMLQIVPYLIMAALNLIPAVALACSRMRYPEHLAKYQVYDSESVSGVTPCNEPWKLTTPPESGFLTLEFQQTYYHVSEVLIKVKEMSFPGIPISIQLDGDKLKTSVQSLRRLTSANAVAISIEQRPEENEAALKPVQQSEAMKDQIWRLVCNPRYMCLVLASAADQFVVDGVSTFLTQFIEEAHGQTKSVANLVLACMIPAMFLGSVCGGWLSKHYGWGVRGMTLLAWTSSGLSIFLCTAALSPTFEVFAVFFVLALFVVFVSVAPIITSMERVVLEHDRELALGLNNLAAKVIGSIGGPIVLGALIDKYPCDLKVTLFALAGSGFLLVAVAVFICWIIHINGDFEDFARDPVSPSPLPLGGVEMLSISDNVD